MQQTTNYKLNLIEKDDVFSPDALNENTQKMESALAEADARLSGETAALSEAAAGLESRVTVLEAKKIVFGYYLGNGAYGVGHQKIELGFQPIAVIVCGNSLSRISTRETGNNGVELTEDGFWARNNSAGSQFNMGNTQYGYIAFA